MKANSALKLSKLKSYLKGYLRWQARYALFYLWERPRIHRHTETVAQQRAVQTSSAATTYDFEIYNTASPILGLRLHGDLEFACDATNELDGFFASRSVNPKLETAIAGFLHEAFNTEYRHAASHMETIVDHGYMPSFIAVPKNPAVFRLEPSDGNWDMYSDILPPPDSANFGGDFGKVFNACLFSSRPYQFGFHGTSSSGFNVQAFGGAPSNCNTSDELNPLLSNQGTDAELATHLSGFISSSLSKNHTQAAHHLEKLYEQGYFVRFETSGEEAGNLHVIRGEGGGGDGLRRSLDALDPETLGGDAASILQACIFSTDRLILSRPSPQTYDFLIDNIDSRLLELKLDGEDQVEFDSFDQLDRHLAEHAINIELESAIAGFLRCADKNDYMQTARHLEAVLSHGYTVRFIESSEAPTIFRIFQKDSCGLEEIFLSLPVEKTDAYHGYPGKLLKACIYACTPYEIEVYQPPRQQSSSPFLLRHYGIPQCKGSIDELAPFFAEQLEHAELGKEIAGLVHNADELNFIPASCHLARIYELGYFVRLATSPEGRSVLRVAKGEGGEWTGLAESLIEPKPLNSTAHLLTACLVACQHGLFVSGQPEIAREFAAKFIGINPACIIQDIRVAQESISNNPENAHPLARSLATGSDDYLEFFRGKTCNHPVQDFEISTGGTTFVCCPSYLPHPIGNAFIARSADEIIQSREANLIRESIAKQDFRFCRWLHCKEIDSLMHVDSPRVKTDIYPTDFRLSYDSTCNLWCVTCRNEKLTVRGEEREIMMRATEKIIIPMLRKAKTVTMNGYGDVFASKPCRQILSQVNSRDNPDLKISFITNAVLFTKAEWDNFSNIHDMMDSVRISIDAATKASYDKIRLGGNWDILMENLRFLAQLRNEGIIKYLSISFVYQRDNFREMAEFAQLGKELGCDMVIFEALLNWNTFSDEELQARSVHHPSNPLHAEFIDEVKRLREVLPPATPQVIWQQKHSGKRITFLSLVSRF